ncbi:MAG: SH3 domain-containing protein, partial [Candidatus Hydrogenedentota bacterium]
VLNVRKKPSVQSTKLFGLTRGSKVIVIKKTNVSDKFEGKDGHWVQIRANGKTGYVFDAYLTPAW